MTVSIWKILDPLGLFELPAAADLEMSSVSQPTTSEEGGVIGVLWGTRDIKSLNYTYFGDVKQVAIKSKSGKK